MANNSIKIIQRNKQDADLFNQIPHINSLLDKYQPQIMIINELNLHRQDNISRHMFPNYKLLTDKLGETDFHYRT